MNKSIPVFILLCSFSLQAAPPFSIVHISDWHGGFSTTASSNAANLTGWIFAHTNDGVLNVRGLVATGDLYEQEQDGFYLANKWSLADWTNTVVALQTNGVFFVACNGNHDAENFGQDDGWAAYAEPTNAPVTAWNSIFPVSTFASQTNSVVGFGYIANRLTNDSRNFVATYTNGGINLAFLTFSSSFTNGASPYSTNNVRAQIQDQVTWMTNQMAGLSNYNCIMLAHFMLGVKPPNYNNPLLTNTDFSVIGYSNSAGGDYIFDAGMRQTTNLFLSLSGHTKRLNKGRLFESTAGGITEIQCFCPQLGSGLGTNFVAVGQTVNVLTFVPDRKIMVTRTYQLVPDIELTNGAPQMVRVIAGVTNQYPSSWTTPLLFPKTRNFIRL